ncbi:MAG: phosphomannomutase/phosphoglucomutase [Chloroflexota bacterium]
MKQSMFREFSIRGEADRDLPDATVQKIGQAIGTYFANRSLGSLVIGHDVRLSSPRISEALIAGLLTTGASVIDIGLVPTPVLNFAVDHYQASGGIMITASHNPAKDNGLKLRAEETLTGQALQDIYHIAVQGTFNQGHGSVQKQSGLSPYLVALQQRLTTNQPHKIVIDGGNGINGKVVSDFLRGLGHTVIEVFTEPDGQFPNRSPDPTGPDALLVAGQAVVDHQADFGFAYDGDGDRVALIDENGSPHYGDIILMLLARHALQAGPTHVVHDVSCTKALADDITNNGGMAHPAAVGYAFVHTKMREVEATLGGETAGHIFYLDDAFLFDDAILASVKLLNYFSNAAQPVSALVADLPRYHTSPNLRIYCPDDLKVSFIQTVVQHYQKTNAVNTIDGAKIDFEQGWALVRQSNTQPAISLRFEGETEAQMKQIQAEVMAYLQETLKAFGIEEAGDVH